MPSREPALDGVLDKRLGVSNKKDTCDVRPTALRSSARTDWVDAIQMTDDVASLCLQTCNLRLADCVGHFGYIKVRTLAIQLGTTGG